MARTWTSQEIWQRLTPTQKAAAMALMEADTKGGRIDLDAARNVLGAIINRSEKTGEELGQHVSKPIYQPTIEMSQFARLPRILQSPEFREMTSLAERRVQGQEGDWVQGATHFLAPEKTMLALEAREPNKYKNWGPRGANWTGYDPATGEYRGVVMRDSSHAFLAPEGAHKATPADPFSGKPIEMASAENALPQPAETPHAMLSGTAPVITGGSAQPSMMATTTTPRGSGVPVAGSDESLLFASAYFDQQAQDQETAQAKLARMGNEAAAAIPKAPGASPMIPCPRPPRVNLQSILSVLRERGVDPTNPGTLGTRRA